MSKQGKRSSANLVAWAVAICMILGVLSPTLMYAQVSVGTDIDGHWAEAQIERWIERGIVKGYEDGTFKPENPIKRCEFAALMNRTFGFVEKAEVNFSDIEGTEWFVEDIAKAVAAGYMKGDAEGTFRPNDPIARQEAALVLARIYELEDQGKKHLFKDLDEIASWSFWAVMAVVDAGLMEGYPDGTFGPKNPIKRSETVTVLDRLVAEIFTEKGVYGKEDSTTTITGNAHVLADGVEIRNAKITGDLLIAQSVGYGTVILDNVTVDGKVKVQGGGKDSIILKDSKIGSLEVVKKDVRIVITGCAEIAEVYVRVPSTIVQEEVEGGGIAVLIIEELTGEGVVTISGNFEEIRIIGEGARVAILEGQVENLHIEAPEAVVELGSDATIVNLVVGELAEVSGTGSITNATINASGTVIEPEPENITIPEGVTAVIAGEEVVGGEEPPSEPVAPPVGPVFVPISAISVEGVPVVGQTLTAKVTPENATVTYQWQRADAADGTFENITGATNSAYTLTNEDADKYVRVVVTGTGSYMGTKTSAAVGPVTVVPIEYASTEDADLDIEVDFGTSVENAIGALAKTIGVTGSKGEEGTATITWSIADYDGNTAGDYTATGVLTLPEGWTGEPAHVTATVTVKADTTAPTLVSLTAYVGEETRVAQDNTLTWTVGETVTKIEAVASEPVRLVDGANAVVTMSGPGIPDDTEYGTIAVDEESPSKVIITPNPGNETAGLAGEFTFTVAAGVLEDAAGNKILGVTVVLKVVPPIDKPVYIKETGVCYGSIQAAVNAADEGNTIVVGADTFTESLPISESLTILGVNADNDARTDDFLDEGTVVTGGIRITGGDVTLKGLTIKNKGILASDITELKLINNKILDITEVQEGAEDGSIIGLDVASASGPITVDTNVFSSIGKIDSTGTAIRIVETADSITITDNIIEDVTKNGINIYRSCLTQQSAVLTINGNVIENWDSDKDNFGIGGRAIRIDFAGADGSATGVITENKLIPPTYNDTTPVDPEYVKLTNVEITVDLSHNYWGSSTPDFNVILRVDGAKSSDCTYLPFYIDQEMETLIEPETIGFGEPAVFLEVYTRPSVLHDGENYHMWYRTYGSGYKLFHRTAGTIECLKTVDQEELNFGEDEAPDNFSVIKGEDGEFYMFSSSSDGKEINVYYSVYSNEWTKDTTPVLETTGGTWYSTKIDNPMVVYDGTEYKMYYQGKDEDGVYKIGLATSNSLTGKYVPHPQPILEPRDGKWDKYKLFQPWVVKDGYFYYMWYAAGNGPEAIGFAWSLDGINWIRTDEALFEVTESQYYGKPSVIKVYDTWYMWFLDEGGADGAQIMSVTTENPY